MAYESPGRTIAGARLAAADLRTKQHLFVYLDPTGVIVADSQGMRVDGVLQNKPNTGRACTIMETGISKVIAGAAIAKYALVQADNGGKAITAATGGHQIVGRAMEASTADGDVIPVDLEYRGVV